MGLGVYYFFFTNEGNSKNPVGEYLPFGQPENEPDDVSKPENNFVGPETTNPDALDNNVSTSTENGSSSEKSSGEFILLTSASVAGFNANTDPETGTTTVRYIEKDQGYIYETELIKADKTRISDTEIPNVYDAYWSTNGKYVLTRYLGSDGRTIKDYLVDLASYTSSEDYALDGTFLDDNIKDVARRPGAIQALSLTETDSGSVISRLNFNSARSTRLFTSRFSEWDIAWPSQSTVSLTTRPSQEIPGYLYRLTVGSSKLVKILDGINGLTTLASPDFRHVLYSKSTQQSFNFYLYNTKTEESRLIPQKTLPEKCVWQDSEIFYCAVPKNIPSAEYPDDWYQGQSSFIDRIMRFDVNDLSDPEVYELGASIDATRLNISGGYVFFLGRNNSSLWARKIKP